MHVIELLPKLTQHHQALITIFIIATRFQIIATKF